MKLLTLTPEAQAYATAAIAVLSLSCAALAGHLHRLLGASAASFLPLYAGLMAAVAAAALAVLDLPGVTGPGLTAAALSVPVGLAAGAGAIAGDALVRSRVPAPRGGSLARPRPAAAYPQSLVRPDREARVGRARLLVLLVLVAALEELLFRGVIVDLARALPWTAVTVVALLGSLVAFAASHVALGWAEMLAKLPLGAAALGAALLLGSVLPAIVAHLVFNVWAWTARA